MSELIDVTELCLCRSFIWVRRRSGARGGEVHAYSLRHSPLTADPFLLFR
jgi:hypothetical protein